MSSARDTGIAHAARCGLLAAWCAAVWYLSDRSHPGDTVGLLVELPDWLLHGVEYAAGGFLARHALSPLAPRRGTAIALLFCIAWALLDEWHQSFVPGRDSAWSDVLADSVGTSLGVLSHRWWAHRRDF